MNFNLVVLQARMSSNRLPGKVMSLINGEPMIYWQIKRILQAKLVHKVVVAISDAESDNILANYLDSISQEYVRGSLSSVIDRFVKAEEIYRPTAIVRLTGDCPFVMPELIDKCINQFQKEKVDYLSNILVLSFPDGLDVEIINAGVLSRLNSFKLSNEEREHVTLGIYNRRDNFTVRNILNEHDLSHFRWTVDTEDDLSFVREVYKHFVTKEIEFTYEDLLSLVSRQPGLNHIKVR
jgi:spore coat polysaccharide biosynthesis protein SpsF